MDRYEVRRVDEWGPGSYTDGGYLVVDCDVPRFPDVIAVCFLRSDALHIAQALNGFNALVSAVKS